MNTTSRRAQLLCGATLILGAMAAPAFADSNGSTEVVVVTGSRLATTQYTSTAPISILSSDDIKFTGTQDIDNLLNQSPQFVGATNGGSTANTVQPNGASGGAYINLRGLGVQRSLVLVNGRRFVINGTNITTDLNTIPTALIDRTEIVTGGSSAVYGSDAISGVINFVMKQDFQGAQVDSHVSWDSDTGTPVYSVDITGGANFDHDRGNVAVSLDYLNRGAIARKQIPYAVANVSDGCVTKATWSDEFPGTPNGASNANCAASGGRMGLVSGGSTSTPNGDFLPLAFTPAVQLAAANAGLAGMTQANGFTFDNAGATARPFVRPGDLYNLTLLNDMQIPQERWMANAFGHYDLLPWVTAYTEMHVSDNTVSMLLTPSNIGGATMLFNVNNPYLSPQMQAFLASLDAAEPAGGITTTEGAQTYHTNPGDGIAALNISRRYVELGNRINTSERVALRFLQGFRGSLGSVSDDYLSDLTFDVYYSYSRTEETDHNQGGISRSRMQNAVLSQGGAAPVCDIFGQTMTPACVAAVSITSTYITKAELANAVASVKGTAFHLPAGPAEFALGGEWRYTSAEFDPDFFLNSGDVAGFNGATPTKGNESVGEGFGELHVPLLSDMPLVKLFSANAAFRYSHYNLNGIGGVWTYSTGADWQVIDDIAFRGQYQRAIRAPNVGELFGGTSLNFNVAVDPCGGNSTIQTAAVRAICIAQGVPSANVFTGIVQPNNLIGNVSGGNPNLAAETSNTITFGTVLTPSFLPDFIGSIDYYSIDVKGAIAPLAGGLSGVLNNCYGTTGAGNPLGAASLYCQAIHRDPTTGQINAPNYVTVGNANLGALKTTGMDFSGTYTFDLPWRLLDGPSSMQINTDWNYQFEFIVVGDATKPNIFNNCVGAFGATCGEPNPRLKGTTNFQYRNGDLTLNLRWRFIGDVTDDRYLLPLRNGATPPSLASITHPIIGDTHYIDLSAAYNVTQNLEVIAGINNLFDLDPPVLGNGASSGYGNTFPSTYDAFGRTFFLSLTAKTD